MSVEYKKLKIFLSEARKDLDFVVDKIMPALVDQRLIPEELSKATKKAWEDLRGRFDDASKRLDEIKIEELGAVGLSGSQLDFKLKAIQFLHKKFAERPLIENRHPRFLRGLLKAFDSILDSLSIVMPLLHPITEFKDALDSITHEL